MISKGSIGSPLGEIDSAENRFSSREIFVVVKAFIRSDESYRILDDPSYDVCADTWMAGGCGILAKAITYIRPDSQVLAIRRADTGNIDHFGVRVDEHIIDGESHCKSADSWLRRHIRVERLVYPLYVAHFEFTDGAQWECRVPTHDALASLSAAVIMRNLTLTRERALRR